MAVMRREHPIRGVRDRGGVVDSSHSGKPSGGKKTLCCGILLWSLRADIKMMKPLTRDISLAISLKGVLELLHTDEMVPHSRCIENGIVF